MRRLWRRIWSVVSGRDRKIRQRLGLLALGGLVVLTGCTHYVHTPPVTLAQHRADLQACFLGGSVPPVALVGSSAPVVAANAASLGLSLVEDYQRDQAERRCMIERGYVIRGVTFHRYGYSY